MNTKNNPSTTRPLDALVSRFRWRPIAIAALMIALYWKAHLTFTVNDVKVEKPAAEWLFHKAANVRISGGGPLTPESKQSANPPFVAPTY